MRREPQVNSSIILRYAIALCYCAIGYPMVWIIYVLCLFSAGIMHTRFSYMPQACRAHYSSCWNVAGNLSLCFTFSPWYFWSDCFIVFVHFENKIYLPDNWCLYCCNSLFCQKHPWPWICWHLPCFLLVTQYYFLFVASAYFLLAFTSNICSYCGVFSCHWLSLGFNNFHDDDDAIA